MSSNWKRTKLDNFISDSIVPDIDVPILKPKNISKFSINRWIDDAKMKISENVQHNSLKIADWILKTEIKNLKISPKTEKLMELVMKSKYFDKPIEYKYSDDKLSEKRNTAFKNNVIIYKLKGLNHDDPLKQMILFKERKTFLINKRLILLKGIKCNETLEVKFEKLGSEGKMIEKSFSFTSKPQVIMNKNEIESALQNVRSDIEVRIDRFTMERSGWSVIDLLNHDLHVNKYDPLVARSYIKLPDEIQNKRATINIQNFDDKCFIYCLGRALDPTLEKKNLERVSTHLKSVCESLGLNKIKTPVNEQDLPKIESQFNISINLFRHSEADIYPVRLTQSTASKHIDLLVTSNAETKHYIWIRNFNRLCARVTTDTAKKYFCKHCIQHFPSDDRLAKHMIDCVVLTKCQAIEMPAEEEITKFRSLRETVKIPFVIYADLESLLEKLNDIQSTSSQLKILTELESAISTEQDKTEKLQKHIACSYGFKVVCCYDKSMSKPFKMYRGLNSVNKFFNDIFEEEEEILDKLKQFKNTLMNISPEEKIHHENAESCYVCK